MRGIRPRGLSRGALELLLAYPWPGNVRELQKEMARAALFLEDGELLESSGLGPRIVQRGGERRAGGLQAVLEDAEREEIQRVLRQTGSIPEAAKTLGLGRSTLYRRIQELGITEEDSGA